MKVKEAIEILSRFNPEAELRQIYECEQCGEIDTGDVGDINSDRGQSSAGYALIVSQGLLFRRVGGRPV